MKRLTINLVPNWILDNEFINSKEWFNMRCTLCSYSMVISDHLVCNYPRPGDCSKMIYFEKHDEANM